jgi:hypothetical protein
LALPHHREEVGLETLKGIAHNVWSDEKYGKAFREDTTYGDYRVIEALRNDLMFNVDPYRLELLQYVSSIRVAACGFVESVEPGGHSQTA